jgi:multiple antibiotic resistance protein
MLPESASKKVVEKIALRSSLVAFAMLIVFALGGNLLFKSVFHIELFSFQSVGGFVVFFYGFMALRQGVFFEVSSQQKLMDLSIVPIASPMIAGPAIITAVITLSAQHGFGTVTIALALALGVNLAAMLLSRAIAKPLIHFNLMGALIRITGLFVASIGVDMLFTGIRSFVQTL